jgi:hypothetical protein
MNGLCEGSTRCPENRISASTSIVSRRLGSLVPAFPTRFNRVFQISYRAIVTLEADKTPGMAEWGGENNLFGVRRNQQLHIAAVNTRASFGI